MRLSTPFRIALGIIAVLLACWSCSGILGSFLVPSLSPMNTWQNLAWRVLMAMGFLAVAIGFALLARWCFTGRGFKRRDKREI